MQIPKSPPSRAEVTVMLSKRKQSKTQLFAIVVIWELRERYSYTAGLLLPSGQSLLYLCHDIFSYKPLSAIDDLCYFSKVNPPCCCTITLDPFFVPFQHRSDSSLLEAGTQFLCHLLCRQPSDNTCHQFTQVSCILF